MLTTSATTALRPVHERKEEGQDRGVEPAGLIEAANVYPS